MRHAGIHLSCGFVTIGQLWRRSSGSLNHTEIGQAYEQSFEGLSAIVDKEKTEQLGTLSRIASKFVRRLPWCRLSEENNGKSPFEKETFQEAGFTSIHTTAYCSSIIFPGINLPNYNDIRPSTGSKSVMIADSMMHDMPASDADCIQSSEKQTYLKHKPHAFYLSVVYHELLGHGTGKLQAEDSSGKFNFDQNNPPLDPIAQKPIKTWYKPGQVWGRGRGTSTIK